jgi:hypothetical protein
MTGMLILKGKPGSFNILLNWQDINSNETLQD